MLFRTVWMQETSHCMKRGDGGEEMNGQIDSFDSI